MNSEAPLPNTILANGGRPHDEVRRLFYTHVGAVALTAIVVIPLLLGITTIPPWISAIYCCSIAAVAFAFAVYAIVVVRSDKEHRFSQRLECLSVFLGLSLAQAVFVLPVLVCLYMPDLRL
jgi:putative flippase GtrA